MRISLGISIGNQRHSSGGGVTPPEQVTYGNVISVAFDDTKVLSPSQDYLGYPNWNVPSDLTAGTGVDDEGNVVAVTLDTGPLNTSAKVTRATDGGNAHFDLLSTGLSTFSNVSGALFTISGVPYAKYDVFMIVQDNSGFSANGSILTHSLGGRERFYEIPITDYDGVADPDVYDDYNVFYGVTGTSFSINMDAGQAVRACIVGVQIRERLDSLADVPTSYSDVLKIVGDSWAVSMNNRLVLNYEQMRHWDFYTPNRTSYAVGGSTFENQYNLQITPNSFSGDVLIWWEGYSGAFDVPTVMGYIAGMVAQKGDDRWMIMLPCPAPDDNGPAYVADIDELHAQIIATYGDEYVFDPRPAILSTDPNDTSVGGLPASAYVDGLHLTDDTLKVVLRGARDKVYATFLR